MNNVMDWLQSDKERLTAELRAGIPARRAKVKQLRKERLFPEEVAAEKAHIHQLLVDYSHKYGLIHDTGQRCTCDECYEVRDWLDEYYGETIDWGR